MRWMRLDRSARLRVLSATILILGLASAVVIYITAGQVPENPLGYDPEDTKKYMRELELYGGKENVLATDLRQWFDSLWHGKPLSFTVAFLTLVTAGCLRVAAIPVPPGVETGPPREPGLDADDP